MVLLFIFVKFSKVKLSQKWLGHFRVVSSFVRTDGAILIGAPQSCERARSVLKATVCAEHSLLTDWVRSILGREEWKGVLQIGVHLFFKCFLFDFKCSWAFFLSFKNIFRMYNLTYFICTEYF